MNIHLIRNAVTLCLVLTLCNLAASFAALRAVRAVRDDARVHIERVDAAITQLTNITTRLCAQHDTACTMPVSAPSRKE